MEGRVEWTTGQSRTAGGLSGASRGTSVSAGGLMNAQWRVSSYRPFPSSKNLFFLRRGLHLPF